MELFHTISEMRSWSRAERKAGRTIAFVPTMGALHEGHVSLLCEAKKRADRAVLSIYVNPTQFAPTEDLARYPRDLEGDLAKARAAGCDAAFVPADAEIYPEGFQTYVSVERVTEHLCGLSRPTHFRGVATVVAKLFAIVEPDVAVFGEKDFQQLVVIRRMARDLNLSVEIVGHPIVREGDGLAMSSRNRYLSPAEREAALSLSRSLAEARKLIDGGEKDAAKVLARIRSMIEAEAGTRIDYAQLVDAETLENLETFRPPALIALAVFVGKTRLIDNRLFPL